MSDDEPTEPRFRELARRVHGAVEIALLRDRQTGQATVVIWDWGSGDCLQLNAEPGDAGYAFTHPFAYAAAHGVPAPGLRQPA